MDKNQGVGKVAFLFRGSREESVCSAFPASRGYIPSFVATSPIFKANNFASL